MIHQDIIFWLLVDNNLPIKADALEARKVHWSEFDNYGSIHLLNVGHGRILHHFGKQSDLVLNSRWLELLKKPQ